MSSKRYGGVLLHPTSLPGKYGIGTLGKECFEFIDFLEAAGQKLWQTLPLGPTGYSDCPYSSFSAFAGNPYMIDLEELIAEGLIESSDCIKLENTPEESVDFGIIYNEKFKILKKAYEKFSENKKESEEFEKFCDSHNYWLEDYTIFTALKAHFNGKPWFEWETGIKMKNSDEVEKYKKLLDTEINYQKFIQYKFFQQWENIRKYANTKGIKVIGDIPMYVAYDSSDCWANPEVFLLDEKRVPVSVAGVPPDYFSKTGQLWGNPVFNWKYLKESNFKWWMDRIKINLEVCDILRFDHFRAFAGFWAVPYGDSTAINGKWKKAFGKELFGLLRKEYGDIDMIAEDLGLITEDVIKLREKYNFTGMKILQFAFDSKEESDFLPHNYIQNSIVYTGTLDNNTIKGWFDNASLEDKKIMMNYIESDENNVVWKLIKTAYASVSKYAVVTMQDLLQLGEGSRMNTPGTMSGNWGWRYKKEMVNKEITEKLREITKIYCR